MNGYIHPFSFKPLYILLQSELAVNQTGSRNYLKAVLEYLKIDRRIFS